MSGFGIEDGRLVITYQDRTVATTGGTLLQFTTAEQQYSADITFPDANKNRLYTWRYNISRGPTAYGYNGIARTAVGAIPQEWSNVVTLGPAPTGADMFVGQVFLGRTKAPSHAWIGQPIQPFIPANGAVDTNGGSILIEAVAGMSRSLTIHIVGGYLVATLRHSVGPAAGNFGSFGSVPAVGLPTEQGIQNTGTAALPVFWRDGAPYSLSFSGTVPGTSGVDGTVTAGLVNSYNRDGSRQAAYDDPTNYSSIYSMLVRGRFGRRS